MRRLRSYKMTAVASTALMWGHPVCGAPVADVDTTTEASQVDFHWGVKIPMRDGVKLQATAYSPKNQTAAVPCIVTLTPYIAQSYHDRGMYFAAHGFVFFAVDVRGRGNSDGIFNPMIQESLDGFDVVEWAARQPHCNGQVAMWGGSYAGYAQWATAREFPPHLATIVPVASPYAGVDFPGRNNIWYPYDLQWLTMVSGHTSQASIFGDDDFWRTKYREWFESGKPFKNFDTLLGNPSTIFEEWLAHPHTDAYWDRLNPTAAQYARLTIPILTITGSYDGDQPGALAHYRAYMRSAAPEGRARHYLVIGPWDHAGTRTPKAEVGGLTFGAASLVDLPKLHLDWYAWTMQSGPKPEFLKKPVAYYVMQADRWRYADTLDAVTAESRAYYLNSSANATDVLESGSLGVDEPTGKPDHYSYDPRATTFAELESTMDPESLTDQRLIFARRGTQLTYHTAPFITDTEVSGFFKLSAWIAIDQPDTDLTVNVYEVRQDGTSVLLTSDVMRARYRMGSRDPVLIRTRTPLRYDFERFTFVSREIKRGSRLRLTIGPVDSIYSEKNYNAGGTVAEESIKDSRPVTVTLYHNHAHPSALFVPIGQP